MSLSDTKKDYERRKQFMEDVKKLQSEELHEIFRILKKQSVDYSENSNGIFFDVATVSDETFDKFMAYMELCKTQRLDEKKRSEEIENIRSNQLKDEPL